MKTAQDFLNDGNKKIISGDFAGALPNFAKSITLDPTEAATYISQGFVREKLNDTTGGIADFTIALEIDPDDDVAWYNRGLAKIQLGRKKSSGLDLKKTVEISSEL